MYKRWGIKVKAELAENVYFEMRKRISQKNMTINKYLTTLVEKDLKISSDIKLTEEEKTEMELSMRNHVNADLRRQSKMQGKVISRKKLSGRHAKKETNTENDTSNLFTRATKGDF